MGVESLYAEPQLRHKRQLRSFASAVERSPLLANTVKALSLLSHTYPKFMFDFFGVAARNRDRCKGYISRILAACHSIERVDFSLDIALGNAIATSFKIIDPSPTANLRQLTVRSGSFLGAFPNLDLPNLEVLCVSQHLSLGEFALPYLPHLHTLQIVGILTLTPLRFDERKLPSLRVLQLFSGSYEAPIDELPDFPNLERLELLGSEEVIFFPPLQASMVFQSIKSLVLGPLGVDTEWLSTWLIPNTLESLVVYLDFSDGEVISDKVIRNLSQCLSSSHDGLPNWSLNQLAIITKPDGLTAEPMQLALGLLRLMCMGWDVSLEFGEIGEAFFPLLVILPLIFHGFLVDMTAWVVDKCSHPTFMAMDGETLRFTLFDERSPIRSVTPTSRGTTAPASVAED